MIVNDDNVVLFPLMSSRKLRPDARARIARAAAKLRALLAEAPSVLSPAERQLLSDWLDRLATPRNPRAPMRRSPPAPRRTHSGVSRKGCQS